jgi:hypothetical protein
MSCSDGTRALSSIKGAQVEHVSTYATKQRRSRCWQESATFNLEQNNFALDHNLYFCLNTN